MGKLLTNAMLVGMIAIALGLASCGSSNSLEQPAPGIDLPWPPPGDSIRNVSDDLIMLTGHDWNEIGGDVYNQSFPPNSLYLGEDDYFAWAIYSLAGFNETLGFSNLAFNCEINLDGPDDHSELFLGFPNYVTGTWEWVVPGDGLSVHNFPDSTTYTSQGGTVHFAVVFSTPNHLADTGYANILSLEIERVGDTDIAPPTGLVAMPDLDDMTLTWDVVLTAEGYHVYRDVHKDFPAPVELTDGTPITELTYLDDTTERGIMYYYKVSSTNGLVESDLSDFVDIFAPENTKPHPYNLSGLSFDSDSYRVTWEYFGQLPNYWWVYYSEEPDFNLDTLTPVQVTGGLGQAELDLKGLGDTIYWRVCASQYAKPEIGKRGFMTDDIVGHTTNPWTWDSPEVLGNGTAPFSWVYVDDDYSAVFINGSNVEFSRRAAGTWTGETALGADTFGGFLSISYGGGEYLIGAQDHLAHDLHAATGLPGAWSETKIHGDNNEGEDHGISGISIQAGSTATEHVVVHTVVGGNVAYYSKPVGGGVWSAPTDLWTASTSIDHMSMAEMDGNIFLLWLDPSVGELMLSDKDGGFAQTNMLAPGVTGIGEYNSLTRFNGEWWTPGYNSTPGERQIHLLNGNSAPWTEVLQQDSGHVGEYADLEALDTKLFCVYYRRDAENFEFAIYDGATWETGWLIIPNIEFTRAIAGGLGDTPLVLVNDVNTGQVIAVAGTPPV